MSKKGYVRFVNSLYALNIAFQAIFSLAAPIGIGVLVSYLLVKFASAPEWIYAPLILLGAFSGLVSMVKFVITATDGLQRLENEQNSKEKAKNEPKQQ